MPRFFRIATLGITVLAALFVLMPNGAAAERAHEKKKPRRACPTQKPQKFLIRSSFIKGEIPVERVPLLNELRAWLTERGVDTDADKDWTQLVDHAFSHFVEPGLIQPTIVYDYPVEL